MPDTTITFFTSDAVNRLAASFREADNAGAVPAIIDAIVADPNNFRTAEWAFNGQRPDLAAMYAKDARPGELARAVYAWVGEMNPTQASDHRLWTYLSCVAFRDFTEKRWPLKASGLQNRLKDRWVMEAASRNALVRNAISRMWWAAHLTHDPSMQRSLSAKKSDPFAYLDVLMRKEDVFLGIMDRDVAGCSDVLFALLDHLESQGSVASEDYARALLREVVLVSGYADLPSLTYEEATSRIGDISGRIFAAAA